MRGERELVFRLPDPDSRYTTVRMHSDLPGPARELDRRGSSWAVRFDRPPVHRLEYQFEVVHHDGGSEWICDPVNEDRASGAFGDKSVLTLPEYESPDWLEADGVEGERSERDAGGLHATLWRPRGAEGALPLLLVNDGPEYDELSRLTHWAGVMIARGELPPFRIALLHPGHRDEEYSASAAYSRKLVTGAVRSLREGDEARPCGMGASLGGLAMLHAQRRYPGVFGGLFLQSGSFFDPRHDSHESHFARYQRVVRFVRSVLRAADHPDPAPVMMTCGKAEENMHNNRLMAGALKRQGYLTALHELGDLHNYTAWRDAFDPYLTRLLRRAWGVT
jgi:enterochelin esterase family protein